MQAEVSRTIGENMAEVVDSMGESAVGKQDVESKDPAPSPHHHRRTPVETKMVNGQRKTRHVCATCREDLGWE